MRRRVFGLLTVMMMIFSLVILTVPSSANAVDANANAAYGESLSTAYQVELSGGGSRYWGRIHSNDWTQTSGQNNCFYYPGGASPNAFSYGTDHDPAGSGNQYGPVMTAPGCDPLIPGTGGPSLNASPPLITNTWPGNLHHFTTGSPYRDMDVASLEPFCDFGTSLTDTNNDRNVTSDGVWCVGPGRTLAISASGLTLSVTLLANDGIISVSGQDLTLSPDSWGILAYSDRESTDTDFPIVMSGSDWNTHVKAILFAPKAGISIPGSDDADLCIQVIAQQVEIAGSSSDFGPLQPHCEDQPSPTTTTTVAPTTTTTQPEVTTTTQPATTTTTIVEILGTEVLPFTGQNGA